MNDLNDKQTGKFRIKVSLAIVFEIVFALVAFAFFGAVINRWFFETGSAAFVADWPETSSEGRDNSQIGNVNVLVLGVDSVDGTHRADTIFLLGINPAKSSVNMLSIPRDTRVLVDGKARKINEILPRYGINVLKTLIENLLKIKINRYAELGFQGFINVIDIVGGIDVDVEKPMHYDDYSGNLHIHFDPGINHMNGKKALEYVRFRGDYMADLGRIKRQQQFVKTVFDKLITPGVFMKLPKIIGETIEHIKTDFTFTELITLANAFNSYKVVFKNMSLPGEPRYIDKISYFMPYQNESLDCGAAFFSDLTALELVEDYSIESENMQNEN